GQPRRRAGRDSGHGEHRGPGADLFRQRVGDAERSRVGEAETDGEAGTAGLRPAAGAPGTAAGEEEAAQLAPPAVARDREAADEAGGDHGCGGWGRHAAILAGRARARPRASLTRWPSRAATKPGSCSANGPSR